MTLEFGLSASLVAGLRAEKKSPPKLRWIPLPLSRRWIQNQQIPGPGTDATGYVDGRAAGHDHALWIKAATAAEVLDLSPGAVVELDRTIQEPVDLLLDGRLVARGEVVVIDGNYGLRVTDVSPLAPQVERQDG
jgi:flagellar motor switch protein FliN